MLKLLPSSCTKCSHRNGLFGSNAVLLSFLECRRTKSNGDMYMPPEMYRTRGTSKATKHYLPKYRALRGAKVIRINLPDYDKLRQMNPEDRINDQMKQLGLKPLRTDCRIERPITNSSTAVFEPYKEESVFTTSGAKEKAMSIFAVAKEKVKKIDKTYDDNYFPEFALDLYKNAHDALQNRNKQLLQQLVTEYAFTNMWHEMNLKSIRWEYVKSLTPPKVIHYATAPYLDLLFAQITVQINSQQKLAIFDQFGRLIMGSEDVARDVLELVVFEKTFLPQLKTTAEFEFGTWRLHAKLPLKRTSSPPVLRRTYIVKEDKEDLEFKYDSDPSKYKAEASSREEKQQSALATN